MKNKFIHILMLLCIIVANVSAQESISADKTSACDSVIVQFTLENSLPIGDYTSIIWNFGDGSTIEGLLSVSHSYMKAGLYNVSCELDRGRKIVLDSTISVSITPFADFVYKDIDEEDEEYRFRFKSKYFETIEGVSLDYIWRFLDAENELEADEKDIDWVELRDSVPEFTFQYAGKKSAVLVLEDENGCSDSITKIIRVSESMFIPKMFSPNGDNINDYFEVPSYGDKTYTLRVFSEAGLQVFFSVSPQIIWDGRNVNGTEVPEGIYYYVITWEGALKEEVPKGYVYIFR